MDGKEKVGGLKVALVVKIMSTEVSRWVVKKEQNYVHVVIEYPLRKEKTFRVSKKEWPP